MLAQPESTPHAPQFHQPGRYLAGDATVDDDVLPELNFDQLTPPADTDETLSRDGLPHKKLSRIHTQFEELEFNVAQTIRRRCSPLRIIAFSIPTKLPEGRRTQPFKDQVHLPPQIIAPRNICLFAERPSPSRIDQ